MIEDKVSRKLAAILYADIAGYSRLTGEDEEGTHQTLKACLAVLGEDIESHGGRIVHYAGDAILADFVSVIDALSAAVAAQKKFKIRNELLLDDAKFQFRIGINLGEVIIDGTEIYGDGVNVAARLEGLADPGGITISRPVYDQVKNKVSLEFEFMGEQQVKNIADPVQAYRVIIESDNTEKTVPSPQPATSRTPLYIAIAALSLTVGLGALWFSTRPAPPTVVAVKAEAHKTPMPVETPPPIDKIKPSIAVLPFNNMSGDKEQEFFSDGMTEDLITDLSKISGLIVISRTSTFAYKGLSPDIREVAKELGVTHVVEGSVRKAGGRVRITAQLIDAATGAHIWADRYDRDMKDIFTLQDEVRGKIIAALSVSLTPKEEQLLARPLTTNPEAYEVYLKGLAEESFFTKDNNLKSQALFERAIELDPTFAGAHAHLAQAYSLSVENNWTDDRDKFIKRAVATAKKGVELDDKLPSAYWSLGRILSRSYVADLDGARVAFEKSVALDPNYADGNMFLALVLIFTGQAEASLDKIEKAMDINPQYPFWYLHTLGLAQLFTNHYEDAARSFVNAIERNSNVPWMYRFLISTYGHFGDLDEAEWIMSELESLGQTVTIQYMMEIIPVRDPDYRKFFEDGLRKAGVPE